jgi:uncharacterized membrane protein (DUF373 family)
VVGSGDGSGGRDLLGQALGRRAAVPDTASRDGDDASLHRATRLLSTVLHIAEQVLYGFVALLLVAGAAVVLVDAGHSLATETTDDVRDALRHTLDSLLLVFILVELLSAVRETVQHRQLLAEPFLLVGIIASIKEIVVIGAFAEEEADVEEVLWQVGVLGAVVLGLSIAALLLRRKEREPTEQETSPAADPS